MQNVKSCLVCCVVVILVAHAAWAAADTVGVTIDGVTAFEESEIVESASLTPAISARYRPDCRADFDKGVTDIQYQISTDPEFLIDDIVIDYSEAFESTQISDSLTKSVASTTSLSAATGYHVRVKLKTDDGVWTAWSDSREIVTPSGASASFLASSEPFSSGWSSLSASTLPHTDTSTYAANATASWKMSVSADNRPRVVVSGIDADEGFFLYLFEEVSTGPLTILQMPFAGAIVENLATQHVQVDSSGDYIIEPDYEFGSATNVYVFLVVTPGSDATTDLTVELQQKDATVDSEHEKEENAIKEPTSDSSKPSESHPSVPHWKDRPKTVKGVTADCTDWTVDVTFDDRVEGSFKRNEKVNAANGGSKDYTDGQFKAFAALAEINVGMRQSRTGKRTKKKRAKGQWTLDAEYSGACKPAAYGRARSSSVTSADASVSGGDNAAKVIMIAGRRMVAKQIKIEVKEHSVSHVGVDNSVNVGMWGISEVAKLIGGSEDGTNDASEGFDAGAGETSFLTVIIIAEAYCDVVADGGTSDVDDGATVSKSWAFCSNARMLIDLLCLPQGGCTGGSRHFEFSVNGRSKQKFIRYRP